jgi:hypothetical protein
MLKNIILVFVLIFATFSYAANEFDKNIIIHNQTRDDKVKSVFKELMQNYEEENEEGFFSLVSEDRFLQDFMLFEQAIEKDFRTYEILDFDYWIDKITSDGVKRYLYVKWEKRYELINGSDELVQRGYSRFLFDEINGKYKLIELAGNNLWGNALAEWKKEVPHIAGEEKEKTGLPDLTVVETCQNSSTFVIKNIGSAGTNSGEIEFSLIAIDSHGVGTPIGTNPHIYSSDIEAGDSSDPIPCISGISPIGGGEITYGGSSSDILIIVDPNNLIEESNEQNNGVVAHSSPY